MYQYKACFVHNKKVIVEGHSLKDIEKKIVHFKREQKHGKHTEMNNKIEIIHIHVDHLNGNKQEKIIKVV